MTLISCIVLLLSSYFSAYPQEVKETVAFLNKNVVKKINNALTPEELHMALSIVAPEVSQYSKLMNEIELNVLKVLYIQKGWSNFSIGHFQIKPSFAEQLEKEFQLHQCSKKSKREIRYDRISRLSCIDGQIEYLLLFIKFVRKKTANIRFETNEEKLLYWATLYNGGLYLSSEQVNIYMSKKQFPKYGVMFNYAQVSLEFYNYFSANPQILEKEKL